MSCRTTALQATRAQVQAMSETNDAMNIEDSGLSNDASSSSFTTYSNTQTDITSICEHKRVSSLTNYSATVAVSWESAALRFPSSVTNNLSLSAVSSLGRESNADSASCRRVSARTTFATAIVGGFEILERMRGLLSLLLLTPSPRICDNARLPFAP